MSSVATQPLSLVFVGQGPASVVRHFGTDLRDVEGVRGRLEGMTITERAVLGALCESIVEALQVNVWVVPS